MTKIESAWPRHPNYRIDITPHPHPVRVTHCDLVLAESTHALLVAETDHKLVIYFPESDVRFDLFTRSDHHTVCPFKGQASYWSLTGGGAHEENVLWYYPDPFPEVAGLRGHVAFYDHRVRVEVDDSIEVAGPA